METVFGIHAVLELLRADASRVERIWLASESGNPRLKEVAAEAERRGVAIHAEPRAALGRRCGTPQHQGVVAAVAAVRLLDEEAALRAAGQDPLLLILDGITDPQNLGAVLRTADAAGVGAVFLPHRHSAPVTAAVVKASSGAAHHVRLAQIGNTSYFIEKLQERNFRVLGLAPGAGADWCDAEFTGPVALVLGSEAEGLRRLVRERCDQLIRLPMLGRVESLNVSAAAAAVLFECVRQRRKVTRGPLEAP
jgi:23S rRNA (guanosine2251-2'-O)-methyltransferase